MLKRSLILLSAIAAPAFAQSNPTAVPRRSNTDNARVIWQEVRSNLAKAADDAPATLYDYKATPDVRSFGEILDHVAASQNGYCRMALGEKPLGGGARTGAKTKAEVVEALRASSELCARAYAQSDEATALPAYGSSKDSRLYVLLTNAMHDSEHYGNIVTYLRLNHMVPPSSQPTSSR
jgi:uncharacterized damage-inducible protein DinB